MCSLVKSKNLKLKKLLKKQKKTKKKKKHVHVVCSMIIPTTSVLMYCVNVHTYIGELNVNMHSVTPMEIR